MAVFIKTNHPSVLLKAIIKLIDERKTETWSYDNDGDFAHIPEQLNHQAWLRPKLYPDELRLGILPRRDAKLTKIVYGAYHGRFIEMLLAHFDEKFIYTMATAQKTEPDDFS